MKKIKTIVVIDNLYTGGVGSSLYNFLYFSHDRFDIDLLVFNEKSIVINRIPNNVKLLKSNKWLHILGKCHSEIKQESKWMMIIRVVLIIAAKSINGVFARKLLWPFVSSISGYDLAIAYAQDDSWKSLSKGCIDFVEKKVDASKKAVIIHCDYSNFGGYNKAQVKCFNALDYIICVSDSCKKSFVKCFPTLDTKVIVCENYINVKEIRAKAGGGRAYLPNNYNFVSICRLSIVKGLDRTILAFKEILDEGKDHFTWTIVGDGPERDNLQKMINEYGLSERIRLVGNKDNPYYYLKNATCLLLPSIHEAAPMVFGEASCLGVPVITTETCSAKELVEERGIGMVVENSYKGIKNGIVSFMTMPFRLEHVNLDEKAFNAIPLHQFDAFIDNL